MKWPVLAHGAWNRWWGPSLTRRTLLALLAAMGLVWLVLLAQMAYTHYETMGTNPGVRQLSSRGGAFQEIRLMSSPLRRTSFL